MPKSKDASTVLAQQEGGTRPRHIMSATADSRGRRRRGCGQEPKVATPLLSRRQRDSSLCEPRDDHIVSMQSVEG